MGRKRKKLQGTVQKVIKPISPNQPEKAQIDTPRPRFWNI